MRKPNFKYDDEVYGKFGEDDFKKFSDSIGFAYIDVSKDEIFQYVDVDFLISKSFEIHNDDNGLSLINGLNYHNLIFSRDKSKRDVYKFEVKTDTRSYETRNVVYEVISHDFSGCMGASKADYIYYVFIDDSGDELVKKESWSIDLTKWREYIREKFFDTSVRIVDSENIWGIRRNNFNTYGDAVGNLLCNIDILQKYGIAKKIF